MTTSEPHVKPRRPPKASALRQDPLTRASRALNRLIERRNSLEARLRDLREAGLQSGPATRVQDGRAVQTFDARPDGTFNGCFSRGPNVSAIKPESAGRLAEEVMRLEADLAPIAHALEELAS